MKKFLIGYQLYSAREDAAKDLKGTLKAIKEMGYDAIEFAGFYGHEAKEVLLRQNLPEKIKETMEWPHSWPENVE